MLGRGRPEGDGRLWSPVQGDRCVRVHLVPRQRQCRGQYSPGNFSRWLEEISGKNGSREMAAAERALDGRARVDGAAATSVEETVARMVSTLHGAYAALCGQGRSAGGRFPQASQLREIGFTRLQGARRGAEAHRLRQGCEKE